MIIMGQYEVAIMINKDIKKLQLQSKGLDNIYTKDEFFKSLMKNLVSRGTKAIEDLEVMMSKLGSEMETKRTKNADCQVEKVMSFCFYATYSHTHTHAHTHTHTHRRNFAMCEQLFDHIQYINALEE